MFSTEDVNQNHRTLQSEKRTTAVGPLFLSKRRLLFKIQMTFERTVMSSWISKSSETKNDFAGEDQ
jgi:hypothetical protein